jgi:hypothetical protein
MTTVEQIEAAIVSLPPEDFKRLARWMREQDEALWDQQIERDIAAGRLEALAAEAIAEYEAGRTRAI